jgi:membrane protein DedA with SNARE-associated domain
MPFGKFVGVTFVGSFLWCAILSFFGAKTLGKNDKLLSDPDALAHVLKEDMLWFVGLIVGVGAAWLAVKWYSGRERRGSALV